MVSRTGIHAIRAVVALAELPEGRYSGAAALARRIVAPANYLGKLLQVLSRTGIVESRKGIGGGFRLARDPGTITLLDVLGPVENVGRWEGCFLGLDACSDDDPCPIHEDWKRLRNAYLALLDGTTIAQILERHRARPGRLWTGIELAGPERDGGTG